MKFSKEKKAKIRKIKQKNIRHMFNQLHTHSNIDFLTILSNREEERLLTLISKFEHRDHYYLLCKNEILGKTNIYELGYSHFPYIRILTDNQVTKRIKLFKYWIKDVNHTEKGNFVKYILRDTGKIDVHSTIDHIFEID